VGLFVKDQDFASGSKRWEAKTALCLASLYAVWGSTFLANKFGLESFPPYMLNAVRFLSGGVILYAIMKFKGEKDPTFGEWMKAGIVGLFMVVGGSGGLTVGQQWVASGLAATLIATVPLWTVVFTSFWEGRPGRLEILGLVIGILGVAMLNMERGIRGNPIGVIYILSAAACWGFGSALNRRIKWQSQQTVTAAQMIVGGAILAFISFLLGERMGPLTMKAAWGIFHLVVFGSVAGFSLYVHLLKTTRPAVATSYALVNPIIAAILGATLAGERFSLVALLAMAVILSGVALVFLAKVQRRG
jgi:drug/metabolite transporter (DMT)-like permease